MSMYGYRFKLLWLAACICTSSLNMTVSANISRPLYANEAPSSAIWSAQENFVVLRETLDINCSPVSNKLLRKEFCDVTAEYHIQVKETVDAEFQFVLPADTLVHWAIGKKNGTANPDFLTSTHRNDRFLDASGNIIKNLIHHEAFERRPIIEESSQSSRVNIYSAAFQATIEQGEQAIQIKYQQPLGFYERRRGIYPLFYISSKYINYFHYEVWPLKEWVLDEDFEMVTTVSLPKNYFNGFQRLFRLYGKMSCYKYGIPRYEIEMDVRRSGESVVGEFSFDREGLPDTLSCAFR